MTMALETTLEAARLYRSTGAIAAALLRPHVLRSWERSHEGKADPWRLRPEALDANETERLREREARMIQVAAPYMRALSLASGGERHAAILGDARAVVLEVVGDEQTVHGPERWPSPGALAEEGTCGTNGIGTPLAENTYVEIVGPEHYIDEFYPFTCQGIPFLDGTGAVAGVLCVSVRRPAVGRRLREIMLCGARAIEMELLAERLDEDLRRALTVEAPAMAALERLLGDILQARSSARLRVDAAALALARDQITHARDLLRLADAVLARFRRQAALWRGLALVESAAPRRTPLEGALREIVELLEVEAATREVEIVLHDIEPVMVEADPHALAQTLSRALLSALDAARGGSLSIDLRAAGAGGELRLSIAPGPGVARRAPALIRLAVPSAPRPAAG